MIPVARMFSIGHSNRTIESFLDILETSSVQLVADIRSNPTSSRFPHFERYSLSSCLSSQGISYRWFRSLGGRVPDSSERHIHTALPSSLRDYAVRMNHVDFHEAVQELLGVASSAITVLLCAEYDYHDCHRWLLSDKLTILGARITHLLDNETAVDHQLHSDLEYVNGHISYPSHQLSLL